jgi:hypothetical protein
MARSPRTQQSLKHRRLYSEPNRVCPTCFTLAPHLHLDQMKNKWMALPVYRFACS